MTARPDPVVKAKTGSAHVAILAAKWSVHTSKLLAPVDADPTKDVAKRHHSDNPVSGSGC